MAWSASSASSTNLQLLDLESFLKHRKHLKRHVLAMVREPRSARGAYLDVMEAQIHLDHSGEALITHALMREMTLAKGAAGVCQREAQLLAMAQARRPEPAFSREEFGQNPAGHTLQLLVEMEKHPTHVRMAIFRTILEVLPLEVNSLVHMGTLLKTAGRHAEALLLLTAAAQVLSDQKGELVPLVPLVSSGGSVVATLVLTRLAEADCLVALGFHEEAHWRYASLQAVTEGQTRLLFEVKAAEALLGCGGPAQVAGARAIADGIKGASDVAEVLLLRVRVALAEGDLMEALETALSLHFSNPKEARYKELLADIVRQPSGPECLRENLKGLPADETAQVYAFLSISLRDEGLVPVAVSLLREAVALDRHTATYTLNLVHILELSFSYPESVQLIASFCSSNPGYRVGALSCGDLAQLIASPVATPEELSQTQQLAARILDTVTAASGASANYTALELELLALFFTLCKILYLVGHFDVLRMVGALLQPLREGRELHLTTTRNEHAYFSCLWELFATLPAASALSQSLEWPRVYVVGDSHTLPVAWHCWGGRVFFPLLTTGCKAWHLRKEGRFFPKTNFVNAVARIPDGSDVLIIIGEIDCREGFPVSVVKGRYNSLAEACVTTIAIFVEVLLNLVATRHFRILVHPVPPTLDPTRDQALIYNALLKHAISSLTPSHPIHWLDFVDQLVTSPPSKLRPEYHLDGTHLSPSYLPLLDHAISGILTPDPQPQPQHQSLAPQSSSK